MTHIKLKHGSNKTFSDNYTSSTDCEVIFNDVSKVQMEKAEIYECEICGKGFSNERYLKKHKEVHDSTRKFECSVCKKKFKSQKHLTVHDKIHRQEYATECEYCDAKFVQRQNLKPHIKKHHPEIVKPA